MGTTETKGNSTAWTKSSHFFRMRIAKPMLEVVNCHTRSTTSELRALQWQRRHPYVGRRIRTLRYASR